MTNAGLYAVPRSGHHAVIGWILANSPNGSRVRDFNEYDIGIGPNSEVDQHILLIRDAKNWLASWVCSVRKWMSQPQIDNHIIQYVNRWKTQAREALGETKYLGEDLCVVKYNQWFTDQDYRLKIAQALELGVEDLAINTVPPGGGGSSWDGISYNGKAQEMEVLTRYRLMEHDVDYKKSMQDEELLELSCRLFGEIG